jgi:hypothetical protein
VAVEAVGVAVQAVIEIEGNIVTDHIDHDCLPCLLFVVALTIQKRSLTLRNVGF